MLNPLKRTHMKTAARPRLTHLHLLAASLATLVPISGQAADAQVPESRKDTPRIVNIVNFIRGVEPRGPVDLLEPVVEQIRLAKKHKLPTTFLIQYDALIKPEFVELLKRELGPNDEVGVWLEVVQPQVEAAGLKWRGRYPWDWHTDVGFTQGYLPEERLKLMDVFMARFKETFGHYPKSAGCWVIDAPTLNYLADKYGIIAACNCKDQSGTDGYTLWGGYWNQAYYPSRVNAFMPAQTAATQLNVPVFRMLGSDPVSQYDDGLGNERQGVVSLEPVYPHGGGSPDWVRWFFDTNFRQPGLAFSYTQAGQENSFGWPAMSKGLIDQYALLEEWSKKGQVRVETLEKSGEWFRRTYKQTPATAVVAMKDFGKGERKSIWYESRFYRVNLYWEGKEWRVRDLHVFNENYEERYMKERVDTPYCIYDTLPVVDGFHWSTRDDRAGMRVLLDPDNKGERKLPHAGNPSVVEQGKESLVVSMPLDEGGELVISCEPTRFRVGPKGDKAPKNWALELAWSHVKETGIQEVKPEGIGYVHNGFSYTLKSSDSSFSKAADESRVLIKPKGQIITLDFE